MSARLLSRDPATGITRWFHANADGSSTIHTEQDVTALVAENRELRNLTPRSARWGDGLTRVASIPLSLYMGLRKKGIADDPQALYRWANDPDNRAFRTREGRL